MNKFKRKESYVVIILSIIFTLLTIFGTSYLIRGDASLIFGNVFFFLIAGGISFILYNLFKRGIRYLFNYLDSNKIYKESRIITRFRKEFDTHPFRVSLIIILICWLPYIISFYPMILSPDPSNQILQFFNIKTIYSDISVMIDPSVTITAHHPVIHTLMLGGSLKLGHIIGNDNFGLFIYSIIQILVLSGVLSYTLKYMRGLNTPYKLRKWFLIMYALFPVFPLYAMSPVKDVLYTCFVILYIIFIYDTLKNKDVKYSIWSYIKILVVILLVVLFRNNGIHVILLSLPVLMIINKTNRFKLLSLIIIIIGFNYSYNNIILPYYKITPSSIREVLSIPFQQTARYVKYYGDELEEDEYTAIDRVLDMSDLGSRYKDYIADPVKNRFNKEAEVNRELLNDYFKVWYNDFFKHPNVYIDATVNGIYGYFYPARTYWYVYYRANPLITNYGFDYHYNSLEIPRMILSGFGRGFQYIPVLGWIVNSGFNTWLMFIEVGYLIEKKKKQGITFMLPGLVTLLVCCASPVNVYFRYSMPYIFSMPIVLAFILDYTKKEGSKNEK